MKISEISPFEAPFPLSLEEDPETRASWDESQYCSEEIFSGGKPCLPLFCRGSCFNKVSGMAETLSSFLSICQTTARNTSSPTLSPHLTKVIEKVSTFTLRERSHLWPKVLLCTSTPHPVQKCRYQVSWKTKVEKLG